MNRNLRYYQHNITQDHEYGGVWVEVDNDKVIMLAYRLPIDDVRINEKGDKAIRPLVLNKQQLKELYCHCVEKKFYCNDDKTIQYQYTKIDDHNEQHTIDVCSVDNSGVDFDVNINDETNDWFKFIEFLHNAINVVDLKTL